MTCHVNVCKIFLHFFYIIIHFFRSQTVSQCRIMTLRIQYSDRWNTLIFFAVLPNKWRVLFAIFRIVIVAVRTSIFRILFAKMIQGSIVFAFLRRFRSRLRLFIGVSNAQCSRRVVNNYLC